MSILLNTDSYKASHWLQYPKGTTYVYSYIEARGFDEMNIYEESVTQRFYQNIYETLFVGMQPLLKEYLSKPITLNDINIAEAVLLNHGEPFNREGWMHILNEHGGYLPIEIKCVPEGTPVPLNNVLATIVNTDPKSS